MVAPLIHPPRRPHLAKNERSGHGTQWLGQAGERLRKMGSSVEEQERLGKVRRRRRSPRGRARGGGQDLATTGHHHWQGQVAPVDQR
jgi:hypothetical protein